MDNVHRYLENLAEERNAAHLVRILAQNEQNPKIAEVYRRLADTEEKHAVIWIDALQKAGKEPPVFHPSWRTRVLGWVAKRLGVEVVLPPLSSNEAKNSNRYAALPQG